jgi:hypothetical protein
VKQPPPGGVENPLPPGRAEVRLWCARAGGGVSCHHERQSTASRTSSGPGRGAAAVVALVEPRGPVAVLRRGGPARCRPPGRGDRWRASRPRTARPGEGRAAILPHTPFSSITLECIESQNPCKGGDRPCGMTARPSRRRDRRARRLPGLGREPQLAPRARGLPPSSAPTRRVGLRCHARDARGGGCSIVRH